MPRIVAGLAGGRRLAVPPSGVRPTGDRAREGLFNSLGTLLDLEGAAVLDLYAGSGALGLEALSRGAVSAVFVEQDPRAFGVLRANIAELGLGAEEARVVRGDALRNASSGGGPYDLVLIDPPYRLAADLGRTLSDGIRPVLAPGARVVTESDRRSPLALDLPLTDDRRYGDTLLHFHTHDS